MESGENKKEGRGMAGFFAENKWVLLMLIPIVLTILIRLEPMKLAPLDRYAQSNVYNFYRSGIEAEVHKQYPALGEEERNRLVEKNFQEFLKANKETVDKNIQESAKAMKARLQYSSGTKVYPYLGDIDSYYWLRMSRNILETGTQCDIVKDGVCYDSYTVAPNIKAKEIDYYPIAIVLVYKTLRVFDASISLMQASFLTPLVFSIILTIPLFLLLRRIGGNITAVIGTVLVNANPFVLSRSLGSDSDIVNILFQSIFLWLAIECFYAKGQRAKCIWALFAGLSLIAYSKFWTGWWYLADLFILSIAFGALYPVLRDVYMTKKVHLRELKKLMLNSFFVFLSFAIPIAVIYGLITSSLSELLLPLEGPFAVLKFKFAARANLWPNVLTTVAEFNSMSIESIIGSFGYIFRIPVFLMATIGMILLIFPNTKYINRNLVIFFILLGSNIMLYFVIKSLGSGRLIFLLLIPIFIGVYVHLKSAEDVEFHPDAVFLLALIMCLVIYFTMTGARFLFLTTIPVSLFVALFFTRISTIVFSAARKMLHLPRIVTSIATVFLIFFFLLNPVRAGFNTSASYTSMVSDEWVATLEKIKAESKPDAIINSWWDFGHWFKYFADRRVTLDGSSQNSPQLHWLGKLLLTSDERTSIGILRMLDCGGNNAFDTINKKMNDTSHSIKIVNEIIVEERVKALEILKNHSFTKEEADVVLKFTHCNAPENFLITSEDMIGKAGVWSHFGSWDFKRAYISSVVGKMPEENIIKKFREDYDVPEQDTKEMIAELKSIKSQNELNAWIAPWPSYYTGIDPCTKEGDIFICKFSNSGSDILVNVDIEKKEAYVIQSSTSRAYPRTVAFVENSSFAFFKNSNNIIDIGVVVIKKGDSVGAMFMDPLLTGSMFTRLFFFNGAGLKSFDNFYDTTTVYGEHIITWKVRWPRV